MLKQSPGKREKTVCTCFQMDFGKACCTPTGLGIMRCFPLITCILCAMALRISYCMSYLPIVKSIKHWTVCTCFALPHVAVVQSRLPVLDDRLKKWPPVRDPAQRMMHTRQFNSGVSGMSVFTADDMIALLQQLPFVVGTGTSVIGDRQCAAAFVAAAVVTRNILSVMKQREVFDDDLLFLEQEVNNMGEHFRKMQEQLPAVEMKNLAVPKFHSISHFAYEYLHIIISCPVLLIQHTLYLAGFLSDGLDRD